MEKELAPIVLFVFNRPEHTARTLESLEKNVLAADSDLIIFADGPKRDATQEQLTKIKETRKVCKNFNGFKTITINESDTNKGLAQNIITGVTDIVNKYGRVIVLEDDIVTGRYFLKYMNDSLERYQNSKNVYAISGWYYPINNKKNEAFFLANFNCWGWATWSDKWSCFKKDAVYYKKLFTRKMKYNFNVDGMLDYWNQIEDNLSGIRNTWFVFWYASAFLKEGLCLYPPKSLVTNSGCDGTGENCSTVYYIQDDGIDYEVREFPSKLEEDFVCKNDLKLYLTNLNKKYFLRNVVRNVLRKLGLYSKARKIYKKIRK